MRRKKLKRGLPEPYYDRDGITIYHGDCQELLPLMPKVGLVLTDPPYGMMFRSNQRKVRHRRIAGDDELPVSLIRDAIGRATRAAYVCCRWDNLAQMPDPVSVIVWVKNHWSMGDLNHEHGRQWEAVCFYPRKNHRFIRRIPDVFHAPRTGNDLHPTQKPESLFRTLIAANVGQTILDPFMGSGTTLLAARDLGRQAIGIEIDEEYCQVAVKRLSKPRLPFQPASSRRPKRKGLIDA